MPNRYDSLNSGHRYGFQGQEKDDEIKGEGNSLNYTFRMHDPRVGRFFAVDPLDPDYPWNSPYAFSENRVIDGVELEGLERRGVSVGSAMSSAFKKLNNAIVEKYNQTRYDAKRLIELRDKLNQQMPGSADEIGLTKSKIYFYSFFKSYGGYTDAECKSSAKSVLI